MLSHSYAKDIVSKFLLATSELLYDPRNVFPTIHTWIFLLLHAPHSAEIKAQLDDAVLRFGKDTVARLRSRIRDDPVKTMLADLLDAAHDTVLSEPIAAGAGTHSDEDAGPLGVLLRSQASLTSRHVAGLIDTLRYCSQDHDDVATDIVRSGIIGALRRRPDFDDIRAQLSRLEFSCFTDLTLDARLHAREMLPDRQLVLRQLESQQGPDRQFIQPFFFRDEED